MTKEYNIAILGATGAVGEMIIEVLEERNFPVQNLFLLASKNSAGKTLQFKGKSIRVENVEEFDWNKAEIAIFSAGGSVSEKWAPIATMNNVVVIDNTSQFKILYVLFHIPVGAGDQCHSLHLRVNFLCLLL